MLGYVVKCVLPRFRKKKSKAWKQLQNKWCIMNVINNGENVKLMELWRHGAFLFRPVCKTLWCSARWTLSLFLHALQIRNVFLPAYKHLRGAWKSLHALSQHETLSSVFLEQLPDTQLRMWLPCVLKKTPSALREQACGHGSSGWKWLWLEDCSPFVKNGCIQPALRQKLGGLRCVGWHSV